MQTEPRIQYVTRVTYRVNVTFFFDASDFFDTFFSFLCKWLRTCNTQTVKTGFLMAHNPWSLALNQ